MKKIIIGAVSAVLIALAAAIFLFSAQNGAESSSLSTQVTHIIGSVIFRDLEELSQEERDFLISELEPFVRKLAHFTEYALLGAAVYGLLCAAAPRFIRRKRLAALGISAVFAAADELHQLFVPDRAGRLTDVLIDSCGAAAGIIFVTVTVIIVKYIREESSDKK